MNVPVVVTLQLPDGRTFRVHTDIEEQYQDSQSFWWTEGNGGCDCNRSLYLNREHHLELGARDEGEEEHCMPCGDTIRLLELEVNGVVKK